MLAAGLRAIKQSLSVQPHAAVQVLLTEKVVIGEGPHDPDRLRLIFDTLSARLRFSFGTFLLPDSSCRTGIGCERSLYQFIRRGEVSAVLTAPGPRSSVLPGTSALCCVELLPLLAGLQTSMRYRSQGGRLV